MIEVAIVGAGMAGSSAALALAERGAAVTVVDAERPAAAATGAAAGMLAPQYEAAGTGPLFELSLRARDVYPEFVAGLEGLAGAPVHLRRDGMLVANFDPAEHEAALAAAAAQRARGLAAEVVDAAEAARLQPGVAADVESWLWLPDEAQIDAQSLVEVLPRALAAAGVRVLNGRRVVAVDHAGGRVSGVTLEAGGRLAADAVLVAAGASSALLRGLPTPPPVRPLRGQLLRFGGVGPGLWRLLATHAGKYLVPRDDGSVLAGSTMDEAGFDRSVTDAGREEIQGAVTRLLPALGGLGPAEHWADLRPVSADGLPILGADPALAGLFYATGYGRNGILLGPLAGRLIADLMLGLPADLDLGPFAPARFLAR